MEQEKRQIDGLIRTVFFVLIILDFFVWYQIVSAAPRTNSEIYFLDVGQGDAELAIFDNKIKILTDAGPNSKIINELEKIPALKDRYIDIAVISHPQTDHFNGFNHLLNRYQIGAFIFNGRSDSPGVAEWETLIAKIKDKKILLITLRAGDRINYQNSKIDFLSPDGQAIQSAELNDTGFVELINSGGMRALLTADIGLDVEKYLVQKINISADVLKIAHHGSKYSSNPEFLKVVNPKVAIIEVGRGNNYGHPSPKTLKLLDSMNIKTFRTDENGTVKLKVENGRLKIFTGK